MPKVPGPYNMSGFVARPGDAQLRAPDLSSGMEDLAGGVARLGAGLQDIQQVHNQITLMSSDTQARAQALDTQQKLAQIGAQYTSLPGQAAVNAQGDTLKQIQDLRDAGQKALSTPLMQRLYGRYSADMFANATSQVYTHAIQQTHVAYGQQLGAETSAAQDSAAGVYQDPAKFGASLDNVSRAANAEAAFNGVTGDAATEYAKGKTGAVVYGAIRNALGSDVTDTGTSGVDLAQAINKAYGGDKLPFAIRQQVEAEMKEPLLNREAMAIVAAGRVGAARPTQNEDGMWVVPPASSPAPGTGAPMPDGSGGYHMPVPAARVTNSFADHQARGSAGVDLAVPLNTPITPMAMGTVKVGHDDRSGNFVMVTHPDGSVSSYAHMGNVSVKDGDQVTANTVLGTVGLTGHTTGAHVHVRLRDPEGRDVDPMSVLGGSIATHAAVTAPGAIAVPDESKVLANIDAMQLPPEMAQRAKKLATEQFRQEHSAQDFQFQQAKQSAADWINNWALNHGNQMPNAAQVPAALWTSMRPDEASGMKLGLAQQASEQAQSTNYASAMIQRYADPQSFISRDINGHLGDFSPGQWNQLRVEQARLKAEATSPPKSWDPYKGSYEAFSTFQKLNPDVLPASQAHTDPDAYVHQRAAILEGIRTGAMEISKANGRRAPTPQEWQGLARNATSSVTVPGRFWGTSQKPAFSVQASDIDAPTRDRITKAWKATHAGHPTDADIVAGYQRLHALNALGR